MNKALKYFISVLGSFLSLYSYSQEQKIPPEVVDTIKHFIALVKADNVSALASLTRYPLRRENPIPDILNENDFKRWYPILFDTIFKRRLIEDSLSDIFMQEGDYGLLDGDIWFDGGMLSSINHQSSSEILLKERLTDSIFHLMHPSVERWSKNHLVCKSKNLLFRIDEVGVRLRYVCWGEGKKYSEEPDIILYDGTYDFIGTAGGIEYKFRNGDWLYDIEDNWMSENPEDAGTHLILFYKGVQKQSINCEKIK